MGEFEAVTEGSAGGENRVPQTQRANFYAEVNGTNGTHFVQKHTTKPYMHRAKFDGRGVSCLPVDQELVRGRVE